VPRSPSAVLPPATAARTVPYSRSTVAVLSPYSGPTPGHVKAHEAYAVLAVSDCLRRGEAPFASHLFYTRDGLLDDNVYEDRKAGIEAGWAFVRTLDHVVAYVDLGVSPGMQEDIGQATASDRAVESRSLLSHGARAYGVQGPLAFPFLGLPFYPDTYVYVISGDNTTPVRRHRHRVSTMWASDHATLVSENDADGPQQPWVVRPRQGFAGTVRYSAGLCVVAPGVSDGTDAKVCLERVNGHLAYVVRYFAGAEPVLAGRPWRPEIRLPDPAQDAEADTDADTEEAP